MTTATVAAHTAATSQRAHRGPAAFSARCRIAATVTAWPATPAMRTVPGPTCQPIQSGANHASPRHERERPRPSGPPPPGHESGADQHQPGGELDRGRGRGTPRVSLRSPWRIATSTAVNAVEDRHRRKQHGHPATTSEPAPHRPIISPAAAPRSGCTPLIRADASRRIGPMAATVLIVDDHATFRALARRMLEATGTRSSARRRTARRRSRRPRGWPRRRAARRPAARHSTGSPSPSAGRAWTIRPPWCLISSRDASAYRRRLADSPARGFLAKSELTGPAPRRARSDRGAVRRTGSWSRRNGRSPRSASLPRSPRAAGSEQSAADLATGWTLLAAGLWGVHQRPGQWRWLLLAAAGVTWFAGNFAATAGLVYLHRGPARARRVRRHPRRSGLAVAAIAAGYADALIAGGPTAG